MQLKTALLAGLASALLTATLPVIAAPGPTPAPPPPITFAQVKAAADKAWDRLDANHDGRIDAADHDARLLERFAEWDTNHDGMISKDEFLARMHAREARWRERGAEREYGPGREGWREHGREARDHDGPGKHPGGFAEMMIVRAAMRDAQQSGVITRATFEAALKARFDAIDTNHDGKLTHEELRAARGHGRGAWRERGDWHHGGDQMMPPPQSTPQPAPPPPVPGGTGQ